MCIESGKKRQDSPTRAWTFSQANSQTWTVSVTNEREETHRSKPRLPSLQSQLQCKRRLCERASVLCSVERGSRAEQKPWFSARVSCSHIWFLSVWEIWDSPSTTLPWLTAEAVLLWVWPAEESKLDAVFSPLGRSMCVWPVWLWQSCPCRWSSAGGSCRRAAVRLWRRSQSCDKASDCDDSMIWWVGPVGRGGRLKSSAERDRNTL